MRPSVRRLEEQYQDRVDFHLLNIDHLSSRDLALRYQVSAIPNIVLLDAQGNLVGQMIGFQTEAQLQAAIEQLLQVSTSE